MSSIPALNLSLNSSYGVESSSCKASSSSTGLTSVKQSRSENAVCRDWRTAFLDSSAVRCAIESSRYCLGVMGSLLLSTSFRLKSRRSQMNFGKNGESSCRVEVAFESFEKEIFLFIEMVD